MYCMYCTHPAPSPPRLHRRPRTLRPPLLPAVAFSCTVTTTSGAALHTSSPETPRVILLGDPQVMTHAAIQPCRPPTSCSIIITIGNMADTRPPGGAVTERTGNSVANEYLVVPSHPRNHFIFFISKHLLRQQRCSCSCCRQQPCALCTSGVLARCQTTVNMHPVPNWESHHNFNTPCMNTTHTSGVANRRLKATTACDARTCDDVKHTCDGVLYTCDDAMQQVPIGLSAALQQLALGERARVTVPLSMLSVASDSQGGGVIVANVGHTCIKKGQHWTG